MSLQADKQSGRDAVAAYIAAYAGDVPMADLRAYVRDRTGFAFGGPTLASFLKALGYRRDGVRSIDTCPGKTVFYVKDAA